jgi:hypothetical protein
VHDIKSEILPTKNSLERENSVKIMEAERITILDLYFFVARSRIGYQIAIHRSTVNPTTIQAEMSWKISTKTPWNRQSHSSLCKGQDQNEK